jgi:hypothetical protein
MDGPDYENAPDTTNLHLKTEEPKELSKIYADHEKYLYVEFAPEVPPQQLIQGFNAPSTRSKNFKKAFDLCSIIPRGEEQLVKANFVYAEKWKNEKVPHKKDHYRQMRQLMLDTIDEL